MPLQWDAEEPRFTPKVTISITSHTGSLRIEKISQKSIESYPKMSPKNEYSNIFKYSDRFQCSTTSSRNGSLNFWTEGMFHLRHLRSACVAMFRCIRTCGSWVSGSQGGSQLGFSSQNLMGQLLCLCLMPMHFMTHRQSHIASLDWKMRSAARDALVDRPRMPQRLG